MSARDTLLTEIETVPDSVLWEAVHFIRYAVRQQQQDEWQDLLPSREVEQEVLDILDAAV
ncbi:MAG: hypothetical protein NTV80_24980 [Verrucomicrobia bacterium]|nr:hypothetical protein [Verrucomicrobiota bacterium]